MTRSEEELRITTHRRESRVARLIRYVETETVTRTVELRREQVRVEYVPVTDDAPAASARRPADGGERWLVLYDEEVVVTTRRVPRERVRLRTHAVIKNCEVSELLQKEQIEIDHGDPFA